MNIIDICGFSYIIHMGAMLGKINVTCQCYLCYLYPFQVLNWIEYVYHTLYVVAQKGQLLPPGKLMLKLRDIHTNNYATEKFTG